MDTTEDCIYDIRDRNVLCYDILELILPSLPVKSLLRFKAVCKTLCELISSPKFVKLHSSSLVFNNYNVSRIHFGGCSRALPSKTHAHEEPPLFITLPWIKSDSSEIQVAATYSPFSEAPKSIHVLGSCNGLLLVAVKNQSFLWNPSIRKHVNLTPRSTNNWDAYPDNFVAEKGFFIAGLGYNSMTDEYKAILCIRSLSIAMFIYRSRIGCWHKIYCDFPYHPTHGCSVGITVNGCPHWFVSNPHYHYIRDDQCRLVIYFDIVNEEFKTIALPTSFIDSRISELGRCLCLTDQNFRNKSCDVWVMKEHGVKDSWTKLFALALQLPFRWLVPLGFANKGDELVLEVEPRIGKDCKIVTYNLKTKEQKLVMETAAGFQSIQYTESLISPDDYGKMRGRVRRK